MCFHADTWADLLEETRATGKDSARYVGAAACGGRAGGRGEPAGLRLVRLVLDYRGDGVEVQRCGRRAWLEELRRSGGRGWARPGMTGEWRRGLGAGGSGRAVSAIGAGSGALVTGWFHHWRGTLYDLRIEGEPEPIQVTAAHPFWSADRQAWVPMIELEIGERLAAQDGSTPRVLGRTLRAEMEPVYNLEVDGDHCYRVGRAGTAGA